MEMIVTPTQFKEGYIEMLGPSPEEHIHHSFEFIALLSSGNYVVKMPERWQA